MSAARPLLVASFVLTVAGAASALPLHDEPDELPWSHVGEWSFPNASFDGNPFDLEATARLTHLESGDTARTPLFYAGDDLWAFRFPGTRLGTWRFETASADADLDGLRGEVTVTPGPEGAKGFLRPVDGRLVVDAEDGERQRALPYNVYRPSTHIFDHLALLPEDPEERAEQMDALLDEAADYGFPAILVGVYHNWFDFGSVGHDEHDRENPDLETFRALESLILRAHERGMFVHLWAWGDERRNWTPVGTGGINGEPDRRLQRYIAARLGPLPGWTMSYGFDLEEWVEPEEVRSWAEYLHEHAGWPPVLTARELGTHDRYTFELGPERLDIYSTDDRPEDGFYELARERLAEGLPVLFERRFLHGRDGVWDEETTLRALWQFTIAGGAGAIWGKAFEDPTPYPHPERFRIFERFWSERFGPALEPLEGLEEGYAATTPDGERIVYYVEDAQRLDLPLESLDQPRRAVAVDTRGGGYEEIDLGVVEPGEGTWDAPHASDWVVAVEGR